MFWANVLNVKELCRSAFNPDEVSSCHFMLLLLITLKQQNSKNISVSEETVKQTMKWIYIYNI